MNEAMTNHPKRNGPDDERGTILSVSAAAKLLGLQRTQMYRLAVANKLPSLVLGTPRRPIHYFEKEAVLRHRREREEAKGKSARKRRRKARPELRKLLALMENGEIDLNALPPVSRSV